jgi:hypothetical protein
MSEIRPDAFDDEERPMPPRVRLPASASRWQLKPLPVRQRVAVNSAGEDYSEVSEVRP